MRGADIDDGLASVRAMVAIARSVETGERVALASVTRSGLMQLGIFAKTFPGTDPQHARSAVREQRVCDDAVQSRLAPDLPSMPDAVAPETISRDSRGI